MKRFYKKEKVVDMYEKSLFGEITYHTTTGTECVTTTDQYRIDIFDETIKVVPKEKIYDIYPPINQKYINNIVEELNKIGYKKEAIDMPSYLVAKEYEYIEAASMEEDKIKYILQKTGIDKAKIEELVKELVEKVKIKDIARKEYEAYATIKYIKSDMKKDKLSLLTTGYNLEKAKNLEAFMDEETKKEYEKIKQYIKENLIDIALRYETNELKDIIKYKKLPIAETRFETYYVDLEKDEIRIPKKFAGIVIGKGGKNIKSISQALGRRIKVVPTDETPKGDRCYVKYDALNEIKNIEKINEKIEKLKKYI